MINKMTQHNKKLSSKDICIEYNIPMNWSKHTKMDICRYIANKVRKYNLSTLQNYTLSMLDDILHSIDRKL